MYITVKMGSSLTINLIEPAAMSAEELEKLQSTLRAVLGFIKYSSDSVALEVFLEKESSLQNLDIEATRVIGMCTNVEISIDDNSEVIDVCKAIQDMKQKARLETLMNDVKNVMESFKVDIDNAMKALKVSQEDQAILRNMI